VSSTSIVRGWRRCCTMLVWDCGNNPHPPGGPMLVVRRGPLPGPAGAGWTDTLAAPVVVPLDEGTAWECRRPWDETPRVQGPWVDDDTWPSRGYDDTEWHPLLVVEEPPRRVPWVDDDGWPSRGYDDAEWSPLLVVEESPRRLPWVDEDTGPAHGLDEAAWQVPVTQERGDLPRLFWEEDALPLAPVVVVEEPEGLVWPSWSATLRVPPWVDDDSWPSRGYDEEPGLWPGAPWPLLARVWVGDASDELVPPLLIVVEDEGQWRGPRGEAERASPTPPWWSDGQMEAPPGLGDVTGLEDGWMSPAWWVPARFLTPGRAMGGEGLDELGTTVEEELPGNPARYRPIWRPRRGR
jgi:hypothetical protein